MESGQIFQERYRIAGQLGTGGQSRVYRAEELSTGRRVAIKLLHVDGDGVRFIREGRVVSRLASPHTVRLIEFDRAPSGQFFMAFEFIAGENLAELTRREAPLPWPRVANLMRQVLQALAEAHALGIVHRDIKPSNIMLSPGGIAKVLDFGVARLDRSEADGLTAPGEVLGTPRYISPEALSGGTVTASTDTYAVGLVAWELLVGHPANNARNSTDIVLKHLDPTPFRLPPELELLDEARRWVTSMCNKDPKRRPADAAEALARLDAFQAAPPPLVAQDDPDYDPAGESSDTGVLATGAHANLTPPEDTLDAPGDETPVLFYAPDPDPTDPDPWRPDTGAQPAVSGEIAPPPRQPASSGIPAQPASTGIPEQAPRQPASTGIPKARVPSAPKTLAVEPELDTGRIARILLGVMIVFTLAGLIWLIA